MPDDIFKGAISADPGFLTKTINPNGSLEKKTNVVVIYFYDNYFDIYRKSSSKPDWLSRETRTFIDFRNPVEDPEKYEFPPQLDNSRPIYPFEIRGIKCSAYIQPTQSQLQEFTTMLDNIIK